MYGKRFLQINILSTECKAEENSVSKPARNLKPEQATKFIYIASILTSVLSTADGVFNVLY